MKINLIRLDQEELASRCLALIHIGSISELMRFKKARRNPIDHSIELR